MKNKRLIIVIAALVVAAAFIVLGSLRGEIGPIVSKGINVCLECIGLGK